MNKGNRPETTLFMLMSVDGKINSGSTDNLDSDKDWKRIVGVREGLHQYYEIEQTTDLWSLNTGRVMAKIGINERDAKPEKIPVSFILIDRKPHLKEKGLTYLSNWLNQVIIVTNNKKHPAMTMSKNLDNIIIIFYEEEINLNTLFQKLKIDYNIEYLTIQSGGTINADFIRQGLVDHIKIIVAPLIIGGKETPSLVDGESIRTVEDLNKIKALKLKNFRVLKDSFIELEYDVINETEIV